MAVSQLDTPLERLATNPTGMNWRDIWDPTTQYYLNDVVVSPLNVNSYILIGKTTLLGGADPTLNPDWGEISPATTGVAQVIAGDNITLGGTTTLPVVNAVVPIVSQFLNNNFPDLGPAATNILQTTGSDFVRFQFTLPYPNTAFYNSMGAFNINDLGYWTMDLQSVCFQIEPAIALGAGSKYIQISFQNNSGGEYLIPAAQGGQVLIPANQIPPSPYVINGGKIWFNAYEVRLGLGGGGAQAAIWLTFRNLTSTDVYWTSYGGAFLCTYYPNGIQ